MNILECVNCRHLTPIPLENTVTASASIPPTPEDTYIPHLCRKCLFEESWRVFLRAEQIRKSEALK